MVSPEDIERTARRIAPHVRVTPVVELEQAAFDIPARLFLKLELLQHTGSFKPRGAFNALLSNPVPPAGVIAASGGNHGAAVAYAARRLGHRAEIFVPASTPILKMERLRSYGATVTEQGATYAEAFVASTARAAQTGALAVHAYDQEEVLAGQGTLARELARQIDSCDTVLIAVGGGGLLGGVAAWFEGKTKVIGVEPQLCPTLHRALAVGEPTDVEIGGFASDSLGARRVGGKMFPIARRYVERVVLVSDEEIRQAQRTLWERLRIVAEPGGATALAALLAGRYRPQADERVAVVVCGGNTDPAQLS